MSDMGPSLRDLAKFAGLAVGLSKQTLVDALVQSLCVLIERTLRLMRSWRSLKLSWQSSRPMQPKTFAERSYKS